MERRNLLNMDEWRWESSASDSNTEPANLIFQQNGRNTSRMVLFAFMGVLLRDRFHGDFPE
jgi:hypothetical protein